MDNNNSSINNRCIEIFGVRNLKINTSIIPADMIDTVIAKLSTADNREQIVLYTHVLDRLLRSGYYLVPLYGRSATPVAYWDQYRHVKTLPTNAVGIDYWWSDKAAEARINRYLNQ